MTSPRWLHAARYPRTVAKRWNWTGDRTATQRHQCKPWRRCIPFLISYSYLYVLLIYISLPSLTVLYLYRSFSIPLLFTCKFFCQYSLLDKTDPGSCKLRLVWRANGTNNPRVNMTMTDTSSYAVWCSMLLLWTPISRSAVLLSGLWN
jgi:hypothetical protein